MVTNETQEQLEARGWDFTDEFIPDPPTVINQDKTVNVIRNGRTQVTPDIGFTGLGRVAIYTDVPVKWTGHADARGLREIGWTEDDIEYYQLHGVNWNEEDDEAHKVTDDNKALYGVLNASNIGAFIPRIVYLPKIDTSGLERMGDMFRGCKSLTAIPLLDTSNVVDMAGLFSECYSLTSIPPLDTRAVSSMSRMFSDCHSLMSIPRLNMSNVTNITNMFYNCYSLTSIPQLDISNVGSMDYTFYKCHSLTSIPQLTTGRVSSMDSTFYGCYSLTSIPMLIMRNLRSIPETFFECYSLTNANLFAVNSFCDLSKASLLTKDSLLYIINNGAKTSAITITLASYAYGRLASDRDVVAALANHPNISIAR